MYRSEADRGGESQVFRRAAEVARNDARRDKVEIGQLRVLCVGIAGMIAVDALIFIYFWAI